jgi:hypothetical protein
VTCTGETRNMSRIFVVKPMEARHMDGQEINGRVILRRMIENRMYGCLRIMSSSMC